MSNLSVKEIIRILLFCEVVEYALCLNCANDLNGPTVDAGSGMDCFIYIPSSCNLADIELSAVPTFNSSLNLMDCSYDNSTGDVECACNYDDCNKNIQDIETNLMQQNVATNSPVMICLAGLIAGKFTPPPPSSSQNATATGAITSIAPPTPTAMPGPAPSTAGNMTTKDVGPAPANAASANVGEKDGMKGNAVVIFAILGGIILVIVLVTITMIVMSYLSTKQKEKYRDAQKRKKAGGSLSEEIEEED